MKPRVIPKYFVSYCLWKLFLDSKSLETPSNLFSLTFLVTLRPLTLFQRKIKAIKWQKSPTMCLTL